MELQELKSIWTKVVDEERIIYKVNQNEFHLYISLKKKILLIYLAVYFLPLKYLALRYY